MATVYRCDRCGVERDIATEIKSVRLVTYDATGDYERVTDASPDLCKACIEAFDEFIKPLPTVRKFSRVRSQA